MMEGGELWEPFPLVLAIDEFAQRIVFFGRALLIQMKKSLLPFTESAVSIPIGIRSWPPVRVLPKASLDFVHVGRGTRRPHQAREQVTRYSREVMWRLSCTIPCVPNRWTRTAARISLQVADVFGYQAAR